MIDWLKARWKWVLTGLAILGAFIIGLLLRKSSSPAVIVKPGPSPVQEDADAKGQADEKKAEDARDAAVAADQKAHDAGLSSEVDALQKKTDAIQDDPSSVNATLLDVGKQVRGG